MSKAGERQIYERQWVANVMAGRVHLERELWAQMAHLTRVTAHPNKKYLIWRPDLEGGPDVLEALTVTDLDVTWAEGFSIVMSSTQGRSLRLTHLPTQVFEYPLFMWIPQHTDAHWVPQPTHTCLRFGVLCRSRSGPDRAGPGDILLSELGAFRARWQQHAKTHF